MTRTTHGAFIQVIQISGAILPLFLPCNISAAIANPAAPVDGSQALALSPSAQSASDEGRASRETADPGESRPMIMSTLDAIRDYGVAPLTWNSWQWMTVAGVLGATAVTWQYDVKLTQALSGGDARKAWLTQSMPTVSNLGQGATEAVYAAALYGISYGIGGSRLRTTSGEALQALAVSGVYSEVFKYVAWSNRPSENPDAHHLFDYSQRSMGMPSGHSFSAFAMAEVYGDEYGRWWTYPLACLIAYSRIYNRAHYTTDVLVGTALGIADGIQVRKMSAKAGPPLFHWGFASVDSAPLLTAGLSF